jgi:RHS repeat-associated protein
MKKFLPLTRIILIGFLFSFFYIEVKAQANVVPDIVELAVLKNLYDSLAGSGWINKTNWPTSWPATATSDQFKTWFGVTVVNGDITQLSFFGNNLTGKMPRSIGNLAALTNLLCYNNKISGALPTTLNQLIKLTSLEMGATLISGSIPDLSATNLNYLGLSGDNQLAAGPIPTWIYMKTSLTTLALNGTNRTGTLSDQIGNLVNLTNLNVATNSFTSTLPSTLFNLTKLIYLTLGANQFTGEIPTVISKLTNLKYLSINSNQFSGSIPIQLVQLPQLIQFVAYGNKFTGAIPQFNQPTLTVLVLSSNLFTGSIPNLSNLINLNQLDLSTNTGLTPGAIPDWIGSLKFLSSLYLHSTNRTGSIPASLGELSNLIYLYIHFNQLTGNLPSSLGNLTKLKYFYASGNQLTGSIPSTFANLTQLSLFYANGNLLSGPIPSFIGNWTNLSLLNLQTNKFTGELPTEIGNCKLLSYCVLTGNGFTKIPASVLTLPVLGSFQFIDNEVTSIPDFTQQVNKANLQIVMQNNRLDFSQLEPFVTGGIKSVAVVPQKIIIDVAEVNIPKGSQFVLTARPTGLNSTVIWEKQNTNATWTTLTNDQDAVARTYTRTSPLPSDEGVYRWRMTNTLFPSAGLSSGPIKVMLTDAIDNTPVDRLYNGLIASMRWRTDKAYQVTGEEFNGMYLYSYDEKYQIKDARWATPNNTLNNYSMEGNRYRTGGMTYDPNGNILSLKRYTNTGGYLHALTYRYHTNKNRLLDVDGYTSSSNKAAHGFKYNAIGQMINEDKLEAAADQYVEYDVTGKVRFVFSDSTKAIGTKKVEYLYDDRGFRLAKKTFKPGVTPETLDRTTWYIRDASGTILSIYEQDNAGGGALTQTEIPMYGSGKLGTVYPKQDGSAIYEITDHLGNARALLRENLSIYTATMEDNGLADITNPAVQEFTYFDKIPETVVTDSRMNHTLPLPAVASPNKASYLHWISGITGMDAKDKAVGPSIVLRVTSGDAVDMETWVRYEKKVSYTRNITTLMLAQFLGAGFAYAPGFDGATAAQTGQTFSTALTTGGFMGDGGDGTKPFAYLNYIVLDQNMQRITSSYMRVPTDAGFIAGEEGLPNLHKRVGITQPLKIAQNGFIYIWVSNESENTKVWFDDLKITHTSSLVTQATDYGVWGDVLREQKSDASKYRFGYQGQYAEKDEETGWNHFELREYDPVIGRWTAKDPYAQYWSPYLAMGNNPVSSSDPDGGCVGGDCPPTILDEVVVTAPQWTLADEHAYQLSLLGNNVIQFWNSLDFVLEGGANVDIGIRAKIHGTVWGLSANADINVVNLNLLQGKGNLADPLNADSWSGRYAGKDGDQLVSNGINANISVPLGGKNKISVGAYAEQSQRVHNGRSEDYESSAGINALVPVVQKNNKNNFPGRRPEGFIKVGKKKDFYGIDIGAGAQFILGADVNLKIGFNR